MFKLSKVAILLGALGACSSDNNAPSVELVTNDSEPLSSNNLTTEYSAERNAYFGDLHVHTMYSFDAFIFGTTSSPDDAYKFARGGSIKHPAGFEMQLEVPLDFYGVSDHAF